MTKTFANRRDAEAWARQMDVASDRGHLIADPLALRRNTFGDLIRRYSESHTMAKKGADVEALRLRILARHPLARLSLHELSPKALAAYRDERLTRVAPSTVRREFGIIRHVLNVATRDWGIPLAENPAERISLPGNPRARDRRMSIDERKQLERALVKSRSRYLGPAVRFAMATGLRRGELLRIQWHHLDLSERLLVVPDTKTGMPRTIPLSRDALLALEGLPSFPGNGCVFRLTETALRLGWVRTCARAGIKGLRFHDLRHEAISSFFELGLSLAEVSLISGHKDPRMLFRYTHLKPTHVRDRLEMLARRVEPH